jgi:hypothetical protein
MKKKRKTITKKLQVTCPECSTTSQFSFHDNFGYDCPGCKKLVHVLVNVTAKILGEGGGDDNDGPGSPTRPIAPVLTPSRWN